MMAGIRGRAVALARRPVWGGSVATAMVLVLVAGCGGDGDDTPAPTAGTGGGAGTSGGASGGTGGDAAGKGGSGGASSGSGGNGASGGQGGSSGRGGGGSGGSGGSGNEGNMAGIGPMGDPACGLDAAAFCDNFDAPSKNRGRAGELDAKRWSGSRMQPDGPTAGGMAFGVRAATLRPERDGKQLPPCRGGAPDTVYPDDDALVCSPNADIASNHLLVACSSQNYGQNSYRIRQPFDFSNRTGKVVFDAEGLNGGLLGWISLDITEEPIGAPSFQTLENLEGGLLPKNGVSFQFDAGCAALDGDSVTVGDVHVFDDLAETILKSDTPVCVPSAWGKLNHFEASIAQDHVEVTATPFSDDGTTFGDPVVIWSSDVSLPFTRGYVQITVHNHATLKYSAPGEGFGDGFSNLDAWLARFDNVGFDGPIVSNTREYEIGDPLDELTVADNSGAMVDVRNTGYLVADDTKGPSSTLEFDGVELDGATAARLAVSAWYCVPCVSNDAVKGFTLRYRFNGNAWIDHVLTDKESENLIGFGRGALGHVLDVPLEDLVSGKNTLEFVTVDVPQQYPPGVANVDLVLTTK